jgi:hypothetical protein
MHWIFLFLDGSQIYTFMDTYCVRAYIQCSVMALVYIFFNLRFLYSGAIFKYYYYIFCSNWTFVNSARCHIRVLRKYYTIFVPYHQINNGFHQYYFIHNRTNPTNTISGRNKSKIDGINIEETAADHIIH